MSTANHSPRVTFSSITSNNLGTVRKLNSVLFPIKYGDKFYKDLLLPEVEDFCKLGVCSCITCLALRLILLPVYYNDIPVRLVL